MNITAVICARNEARYLEILVPYLAAESIELVLIDNGSSDGTLDRFTPAAFPNIVETSLLPFDGVFDLSRQLSTKGMIIERLTADWIIHQDADEILHAPEGWGGLRRSIEAADCAGFNVVNFQELVMLPKKPEIDDVLTNNLRFYYFDPRPLRLMRAWRRDSMLSSMSSGGHVLSGGDVRVFPATMIMKHFIVRSQQHAFEKYLSRAFAEHDVMRGWHGNRLNITRAALQIPSDGPWLHELNSPFEVPVKLPRSAKSHFWQWPQAVATVSRGS